jgi:hypothetical protein
MWQSISSISTQHRDHLTGGLHRRVVAAGSGSVRNMGSGVNRPLPIHAYRRFLATNWPDNAPA